jgi:hypothetical protein
MENAMDVVQLRSLEVELRRAERKASKNVHRRDLDRGKSELELKEDAENAAKAASKAFKDALSRFK